MYIFWLRVLATALSNIRFKLSKHSSNESETLPFFSLGPIWRLGALLISVQYPSLSDQLSALQWQFICFMPPNHSRFISGSVLAEYMHYSLGCAQYSEWENRSRSWSSWDIHRKQSTLSLHPSLSCVKEFPSIALSNCYRVVQPATCSIAVWATPAEQERNMHCFLSPLTGCTLFLCHQHSRYKIAAERGDIFLPHSDLMPNPVSRTLVQLVPIKYTAH